MKPLMLIVADHASVESSTGKLNILGVFRNIRVLRFPARHHALSVVMKLAGEIDDKPNPHTLTVTLTDNDGRELLSVSGPFDMPPGEPGIDAEFNAVIELRDIIFSHPGAYTFFVRVDGEVTDQTVIQVAQLPNQAQE